MEEDEVKGLVFLSELSKVSFAGLLPLSKAPVLKEERLPIGFEMTLSEFEVLFCILFGTLTIVDLEAEIFFFKFD